MSSRTDLQEEVLKANLQLQQSGLVLHTFGNVSGCDRSLGMFAIKPSGVPYPKMTADQMVLVDLDGNVVDSKLRPSTDTPTHLVLYQAFEAINGVAHTHSTYATSWAQAKRAIPCYGTTHADYSNCAIPCTEELSDAQIKGRYEYETGVQIVRALKGLDPALVEMIIIASHGPFTWGKNAYQAVHNAVTLEQIAKTAFFTELIANKDVSPCRSLVEKHFERKRGKSAYYGQAKTR